MQLCKEILNAMLVLKISKHKNIFFKKLLIFQKFEKLGMLHWLLEFTVFLHKILLQLKLKSSTNRWPTSCPLVQLLQWCLFSLCNRIAMFVEILDIQRETVLFIAAVGPSVSEVSYAQGQSQGQGAFSQSYNPNWRNHPNLSYKNNQNSASYQGQSSANSRPFTQQQ